MKKLALIVAIVSILAPVIAQGSITVGTTTSANVAVATSTLQFNHDCGSAANTVIVVGVQVENNTTPANMPVKSVTYGALNLTKLDEQDTTVVPAGSADISSYWYGTSTPTGVNSLVITTTGTIEGMTAGATCISNVSQGAPNVVGGNKANSALATTTLTMVTSNAPSFIMIDSLAGSGSTVSLAPTSSQTRLYNQTSTGHLVGGMSYKTFTVTSTYTMTWSIGSAEVWAMNAAIFEEFQSAGTPTARRRPPIIIQ